MVELYQIQEGGMDILVMLEENPDHSPVLAHVNSVPSPLHSSERPSRDIVTLYGAPSPESVALALAAAVESHRSNGGADDRFSPRSRLRSLHSLSHRCSRVSRAVASP